MITALAWKSSISNQMLDSWIKVQQVRGLAAQVNFRGRREVTAQWMRIIFFMLLAAG